MRHTRNQNGRYLATVIFTLTLLLALANLQADPRGVGDSLDAWSRSMGESILDTGERAKTRLLERSILVTPAPSGERELSSGTIYQPGRSQVWRGEPDGEEVL